ncbi:tRNA pseudouridine(38-40) synthase TruA [Pseudemcibacter aquimaris]|uniref:tRNA pseudouridine(38-40) synthase TruA n=1 Tax=Pseudemcibacter aquimaris TaxID=2857064 RepID=UPI002013934E|nr:tRNA pseudouridine(38-40) synthase TruA [Pseudemcibacter aquimaris]MCC3861396.1 tRNA pseudouridine(38-40) synthase TruA [Pseudemcibacter aquimaris]WDU58166.1 tRNA pseudouridine(38-40) synthase TruA [Pseudemcibacter aquimaris]
MKRFKLTIEFDGSDYHGWQLQESAPSIQGELEKAAHKLCQQECRFHAAGRTDAGVHATGMVAHTDIPRDMNGYKLMEALNYHLKNVPISILDAEEVDDEFHARFSAKKRYYRYHIINRRANLTFQKGLAWQVRDELDVDAMNDAAQVLVGKHDFTTFRSVQCQSKSPLKTLESLSVSRDGENIYIDTSAISYLHHQVRSMVGCLYYVGKGKWTRQDLKDALEAADRSALGYNAPPDGLYFMKVDY